MRAHPRRTSAKRTSRQDVTSAATLRFPKKTIDRSRSYVLERHERFPTMGSVPMMKRGVIATLAVAALLSLTLSRPAFAQSEEDSSLDAPAKPSATATPPASALT